MSVHDDFEKWLYDGADLSAFTIAEIEAMAEPNGQSMILPGTICDDLEIPPGSTYRDFARAVLDGLDGEYLAVVGEPRQQ